jgi:hypothetical protein
LDYSGARPIVDEDDDATDYSFRKSNRDRVKQAKARRPKERDDQRKKSTNKRKPDGSETFRCRHCRTIVGPTLSGGRHRNHCPLCLYSLHVDGKTPGDRNCDCHSLMAPVGMYARPSGEQVIVHQCLGCGFERFNRVAADDNPLAVMRLSLINPPALDENVTNESTSPEQIQVRW